METQLTDLTEKFQTIKAKRLEDRNKLKEADKMKIICDQVWQLFCDFRNINKMEKGWRKVV